MRYLDLHISQPEWMLHPMQEFIRHGDAIEYEELRTWNLLPGREVEYELFYVVGDLGPYRATIDDIDSVRAYTITEVDDESFYVWVCQETREQDLYFREAFLDLELVTVPPIVIDDRADMHMTLVGEGENLQQLVEAIPDDIETTVEEIGEYDRRYGTLAGAMTDRQYEAVRVAVELGYYETPREATLEDVADALHCAPSTASDHLQKAEAAVLNRLVEGPRSR